MGKFWLLTAGKSKKVKKKKVKKSQLNRLLLIRADDCLTDFFWLSFSNCLLLLTTNKLYTLVLG